MKIDFIKDCFTTNRGLVLHVVSILILMTNNKAGVSHFGDQHPGLDHSMLRDSPSVMTSNDSSIMKIVTIDGLRTTW